MLAFTGTGDQDGGPLRRRSMPQTLFEKIWAAHLVARRGNGRELIYIDRHVLHELHAPHAFEQLTKQQRRVRRPDLTFSMQDHTVATKPGRDDTTNPSGAAFLKAMRDGSRRNRIRLFDIDDPEQGISHVVAPELGMVLPGATHAVPDSHASTVGGLGALAFGCGTTELAHILATQVMAMKRPKSMLIRLDGTLAAHVTAKDMVLGISDRVPNPSATADLSRRATIEGALAYMGLIPGTTLVGLPVNRVFIGSCTNARLPDLQAAAAIVRGRRVAEGVIAMVVPGSSAVKREAEAAGLDRVFRDAGFFWGESGCSMCAGGNGDRGEPGDRIVSTTNRNFENRQGPKVRTHLASPETAAATAIAGRIADVSQLTAGRA